MNRNIEYAGGEGSLKGTCRDLEEGGIEMHQNESSGPDVGAKVSLEKE